MARHATHPAGLRNRIPTWTFAAASLLAWASTAHATVWVVHPDGTGDFPTIQSAISAAQDGDEVVLSNGTFRGDGNINISLEGKAITVRSLSDDPVSCVIDCEATDTEPQRLGFYLHAGEGRDSVIRGISIRNGGYDLGGGIYCGGSSPSILNCRIEDCLALEGGGMGVFESSPMIDRCVFTRNMATTYPGGGLFIGQYSQPVISNTTIVANSSGEEGGYGNREGGGIAVYSHSFALLDNCIIVGNFRGEGAYCDNTSVIQIRCSDVFGNEGGDWVGFIADQEHITDNISAPPLFCDPVSGDYHLSENSPCAGATSPCGLMGALDVQCGTVGLAPLGWSRIKTLYR